MLEEKKVIRERSKVISLSCVSVRSQLRWGLSGLWGILDHSRLSQVCFRLWLFYRHSLSPTAHLPLLGADSARSRPSPASPIAHRRRSAAGGPRRARRPDGSYRSSVRSRSRRGAGAGRRSRGRGAAPPTPP